MTIDEARTWLQRHADNTPMPGARKAYKTILDELNKTCQNNRVGIDMVRKGEK